MHPRATQSYARQKFPLFDPVRACLLGYEKRAVVHRTGLWHKGIQAHIIRPSRASRHGFEILLQTRSGKVDISRQKIDQSVAVQMIKEDGLSEIRALKRGVRQELGLSSRAYNYIQAQLPTIRIIKTYGHDRGVLNRELISLYIITLKPNQKVTIASEKIAGLVWTPWELVLEKLQTDPNAFTRTGYLYFSHPLLQMLYTPHRFINGQPVLPILPNIRDYWLLHADMEHIQKTVVIPKYQLNLFSDWFDVRNENDLKNFFAKKMQSGGERRERRTIQPQPHHLKALIPRAIK